MRSRMGPARRWPLLTALTATLAACGAERTEPTGVVPNCAPGVTLEVSRADTAVRFAWSPTCAAVGLIVEGEGLRWTVLPATEPLVGPVRYGEAPPGALAVGFVQPLVVGSRYRAILTSRGTRVLSSDTVAVTEFTR